MKSLWFLCLVYSMGQMQEFPASTPAFQYSLSLSPSGTIIFGELGWGFMILQNIKTNQREGLMRIKDSWMAYNIYSHKIIKWWQYVWFSCFDNYFVLTGPLYPSPFANKHQLPLAKVNKSPIQSKPKVIVIDQPIPIRSSDCIGLYCTISRISRF